MKAIASRSLASIRGVVCRQKYLRYMSDTGLAASYAVDAVTLADRLSATIPATPAIYKTQVIAKLDNDLSYRLGTARDAGDAAGFVKELKSVAAQTVPNVQAVIADSLLDLIQSMAESIPDTLICEWLWALGRLGYKFASPAHQPLLVFGIQKLLLLSTSSRELCTALDGLSLTGMTLSDLSVPQKCVLLKKIDMLADLDPRALANVLRALHKLGESWYTLPVFAHQSLWYAMRRNMDVFEAGQNPALLIHSLGQLGVIAQTLDPADYELLLQIAKKGLRPQGKRSAKGASTDNNMTILGLAKMGIQYDWLSDDMKEHMASCLTVTLLVMDGQAVSNICYAFGLMGCQWSTMSAALQQPLLAAIIAQLPDMAPTSIFMTLHGLASMGAQRVQELQASVEKAVYKLTASSDSQALAISIYSIAGMDTKWMELPHALRSSILQAFSILSTPQHLSLFLYGLGQMGANMNPTLLSSLSSASLDGIKANELADLLLGLANMETALWHELPLEGHLAKHVGQMSGRDLESALYSIAVMEAHWLRMELSTLQALVPAFEANAPVMKSQEVANSMYGLAMMSFDLDASNATGQQDQQKLQLLWRMFEAAIQRFRMLTSAEIAPEDLKEFSIFFELLRPGLGMIAEDLGSRSAVSSIPSSSDASQPLPSRHRFLSKFLLTGLAAAHPDRKYEIVHELPGLEGVFAMDMAIKQEEQLLAFIEVDDLVDFSLDGQRLKRKNLLKEFLYAQRYPHVPLHRVRNADLRDRATVYEVGTKLLTKLLVSKEEEATVAGGAGAVTPTATR